MEQQWKNGNITEKITNKEQKNNIKNRVQKYESVAMYFITLFFIIMKIVYYLI